MTIQNRPIRNAPIIVGASQAGLSISTGSRSARSISGRLSFFFLRSLDLGIGVRIQERMRPWEQGSW